MFSDRIPVASASVYDCFLEKKRPDCAASRIQQDQAVLYRTTRACLAVQTGGSRVVHPRAWPGPRARLRANTSLSPR